MFMTFYNVDMEKAKNINDLLEEYERMEAIIDLFFKKDVENKELEELRRWLTVSINYFRRFQKVLSTLKIKDEKINIKEAEEKEFLIEKLYLLLIENGKIRSNQKIKSINDVEIDKAVIGEPIFVVYVNEQNIDLFGNVITFYMVSSIFNAIAEDIKKDENGKKKLLFSDTDSNPMYRVYSGFLNKKEAEKEEKKESDIHRWMNTRCLGTVPEVHEKRRSRSTMMRMILTDPKVEEKMQESFRIIRNKIEYNAQEYHMKTFLVTSALAGEGKSTVAVNLALSLAQAGQRVTLVDCDLRHPTDRQILGIEENGVGLREVLEHKAKLKECLMKAEDIGLDPDMCMIFLPGGKTISDGSDLLGTELMGRIIEKLEEISDFVILDSAPAGLLTDAVVLAQYADGAAFVVRKDFARVDYIMDGMEHLAESNIQIIGGILNGV